LLETVKQFKVTVAVSVAQSVLANDKV